MDLSDPKVIIQGIPIIQRLAGATRPEPDVMEALIQSEWWPLAAPESVIVKDKQQKVLRARSVVSSFDIAGPKISFLDFGCGEGHICAEAANRVAKAVGYDIKRDKDWGANGIYTDDFEEAIKQGPYDIILMYDVIDHIVKGSQIEVLERAVKLLKPKGTLYIRCHPWTSRHGVHQYTKLNKAYIQFFLPPDILKKYCAEETVKILRPKRHYHKLFKGAGLKIGDCNDTTTNVDPFFRDEYITNMMLETYGQDRIASHANFHHLISMSFIDYKLKHAN